MARLRSCALCLLLLPLAACDVLGPGRSRQSEPAWITATGVLLAPGDSVQLSVSTWASLPDGEEDLREHFQFPPRLTLSWPEQLVVNWSVSDPTVARVSSQGVVHALAEGSVVVTVAVNERTDTATLHVLASPAPARGFRSVYVGHLSACALDERQRAHCWGLDDNGALGRGRPRPYLRAPTPGPVAGELAFTTLSTGGSHTCGIGAGEQAYCWGKNWNGELGDGRVFDHYSEPFAHGSGVPVPVRGGHRFRAIAAGARFTCALDETGAAWCWGTNGAGQLGIGTQHGSPGEPPWGYATPQRVHGDLRFASIAAGTAFVCALDPEGRAYCWGENQLGQLGAPSASLCEDVPCGARPQPVDTEVRFTQLAPGLDHSCGVSVTGEVYCWGRNDAGQSGQPGGGRIHTPARVAGLPPVAHVTVGYGFSCALATDGTGYCWGGNGFGQLGRGAATPGPDPVPQPLAGGLRLRSLSARRDFACAVSEAGLTYCWGVESGGRLGTGQLRSHLALFIGFVPGPALVREFNS